MAATLWYSGTIQSDGVESMLRSPLMHLTRIGQARISKQDDVLLSATLNEREIEV